MSRRFVVWLYAPGRPMWHAPPEVAARLRDALPDGWEVEEVRREAGDAAGDGAETAPPELLEAIREAEAYAGWGLPREAFRAAERLAWVHTAAAGVGSLLYPELRESDVVLTNAAGVYAEPMAEHALALMLHFARGLDVAVAAGRRGAWARRRLEGADVSAEGGAEGAPAPRAGEGGRGAESAGPGTHGARRAAGSHMLAAELAGARLGVVGYGATGSALGRRAAALGMEVWGLRRSPGAEPPGEVARMLGPDGLDELLEASDYVALCVPETDETRGLLGAGELGRMRPSAVLVNVARGSVVDEDAVADALREGRLRGAGLDVFREEPLPPGSPLWALENCLVTPHASGVSPRIWERQTALLVENARRWVAGEPLRNVVEAERGY